MIVLGQQDFQEFTVTDVSYKKQTLTDAGWSKLALTSISAPLFAVTDVSLLNKIFFYRVKDIVQAVDFVDSALRSPTEEIANVSEYVGVTFTTGVLETVAMAEWRGISLVNRQQDAISVAGDLRRVQHKSVVRDTANTKNDIRRSAIQVFVKDYVSLNESIVAGHSMYANINNVAVPVDALRWDYTDSKPEDFAATAEDFRIVMRPFAPSVLGTLMLGQSTLGV